MTTFHIGGDLAVRRLGFGAMQLPTEAGAARAASRAVVRRAVELGVTLIDTAYLYGGGANEDLLAEALYPYPDGLVITTKVGVARSGRSAPPPPRSRSPGSWAARRSCSRSPGPPGWITWRRTSPRRACT